MELLHADECHVFGVRFEGVKSEDSNLFFSTGGSNRRREIQRQEQYRNQRAKEGGRHTQRKKGKPEEIESL